MAALSQCIERLGVPHPAIQRLAVQALVQLLSKQGTTHIYRDKHSQICLRHRSPTVVSELCRLLLGPRTFTGEQAQELFDMVLAALGAADAEVESTLVNAAVELYSSYLAADHALDTAHKIRKHPLVQCARACPKDAEAMLCGVPALLNRAAASGGNLCRSLLSSLLPFFGYVLLGYGQGQGQIRGMSCEASYMECFTLDDLLDLVNLQQPIDTRNPALVETFAAALVDQLFQAQQANLPTLPTQPVSQALCRLASTHGPLLLPFASSLAYMSLTAGEEEAGVLLTVCCQLIANGKERPIVGPWLKALLLLPAISGLSWQPPSCLERPAKLLLHLITATTTSDESMEAASHPAAPSPHVQLHTEAALMQRTEGLLMSMWAGPEGGTKAMSWLRDVRHQLEQQEPPKQARQQFAEDGSSSADIPAASPELSPAIQMALTALLSHPLPSIKVAAASVLQEAGRVYPLLGMTFVPVLIHAIQSILPGIVELGDAESHVQVGLQGVLLALLNALPAMGVHAAVLPFVLQTLQRLTAPGVPEILQITGIRLHVQLWQQSNQGRRGPSWARLQDLLMAGPPSATPPPAAASAGPKAEAQGAWAGASRAARMAWASSLLAVCQANSSAGLQLVSAIQAAMEDTDDAVSSLGLAAIADLCAVDALDFYAAWRVVHQRLPRLPAGPLAAAQWISMLQHGTLDALVQPERAAAIVELLRGAVKHSAPKVRAAAYEALACWELELLEQLEVQQPLQQLVELLLWEEDSTARQACAALVDKALAFEHTRRRRYQASSSTSPAKEQAPSAAPYVLPEGPQGEMLLRLTKSLPHQLIQAGAGMSMQESSQGAELFLWAPHPTRAPSSDPSVHTDPGQSAAAMALEAYNARFSELIKMKPHASGISYTFDVASWSAFMSRWLAAAVAAAKVETPDGSSAGEAAAARLWDLIQSSASNQGASDISNCCLAGGALCTVLPARARRLTTTITSFLQARIHSQRSSAEVKGAAAALAAAIPALPAVEDAARASATEALLQTLGPSQPSHVNAAVVETLGAIHPFLSQNQACGGPGTSSAAELAGRVECALLGLLSHGADGVAGLQELLRGRLAEVQNPSAGKAPEGLTEAAASSLGQDPAVVEACFVGVAAVCMGNSGQELQGQVEELLKILQAFLISQMGLPTTAGGISSQQGPLTTMQRAQVCGTCAAMARIAQAMSRQDPASLEQSLHILRLVVNQTGSHGAIVGAAAASLGALQALASISKPGPDPSRNQQADTLKVLVKAVARLDKMGGRAAAEVGLAMGLASLIGCRDAAQVPLDAGNQLLDENNVGIVQLALQALDELAGLKTGQAKPPVAWILAAVCRSARQAVKEAGRAKAGSRIGAASESGRNSLITPSQSRSLQALPADGAMRPAVSALLQSYDPGNSVSAGRDNLASLLSCLARAPKLPALDWGALCQTLIRLHPPSEVSQPRSPPQPLAQSPTTQPAAMPAASQHLKGSGVVAASSHRGDGRKLTGSCQLEATAVEMAVRHGADPSLGLDVFLRGVVQEDARLGRLARAAPEALQQLAQQLPQVVAILPESAGPDAVKTVAAVCSDSPSLPNRSNTARERPRTAAWAGLTALLEACKDGALAQTASREQLKAAVAEACMSLWQGQHSSHQQSDLQAEEALAQSAASCLRHLPPGTAAGLLQQCRGSGSSDHLITMSHLVSIKLVQLQHLDWSHLQNSWTWAVEDDRPPVACIVRALAETTTSAPVQRQAELLLHALSCCKDAAPSARPEWPQKKETSKAAMHVATAAVAAWRLACQDPCTAVSSRCNMPTAALQDSDA
ncbi:hypothetical protein WJX74_003105 [Apatococcus lobatus]|uniref:DUF3730 domain-containing protein n=1 Tax=Apatococcus lobatus TaxID=904363 RepID=A0AAW1QAK2_9CHLO